MSTIVTRAGKGDTLSWTEMDSNFSNLNTDKIQSTNSGSTGQVLTKTSGGAEWAAAAGGGAQIAVIEGTLTYQEFTGLTSNVAETTLPHSWAEKSDVNGLVTVSGDNWTITNAGTYLIEYCNNYNPVWFSSSAGATNNIIPEATFKLYNSSDATSLGQTRFGNDRRVTASGASFESTEPQIMFKSVVTIAGSKTFNIRYGITTAGTWGGGLKLTYTYSPNLPQVKITKLA
jgi:hypothetical protein